MKAIPFMLFLGALGAFQEHSKMPELRAGDKAPDFTLKLLNSDKTFKLSDNFGKRPTILIFGSYT